MTCIVGIEHDGFVWMGGDSSCNDSESDSIMVQREPKVFQRGSYLIGFAGSFRVGAILKHIIELPFVPKSGVEKMMVTDFPAELRKAFSSDGLDDDSKDDWEALIGIRGKLYVVEPDFHVWRHREPYAAIGSGMHVALGALYALSEEVITAQQKIEIALGAAEKFIGSVKGPWTILTTRVPRKSKDEI